MIEKIKKNIKENCKINEKDRILLGLSGGPDSVFLFHALRILKDELGFEFFCAHINHMYRGKDADDDEEFVKKLCSEHKVECYVLRKDASKYSKEKGITEEEGGREIRYDFFDKLINEKGGGYIATAHNYNDQVETLVQRIIRGTGTDGLAGMDFRMQKIIRPILNIKREEIEKFIKLNNYQYCIDKTNLEPIYGRNKIRLDLIPYIEKKYNLKFSDSIFRLSQIAKLDGEIIRKTVDVEYKKILIGNGNKIVLDLNGFNDLDLGLKYRVLRKGIEEFKGDKTNIEFAHLEKFIDICSRKETGKSTDLPNNIKVEISYEKILIKNKDEIKDFEYNISIGERLHIKETGQVLKCYKENEKKFTNSANTVWIDYDKITGKLKVRNRRMGDKFRPLGMNGEKKLKDFFIDEKIPRELRNIIPIISDENEIIWIAGYRLSENYKIDSRTKNILAIIIEEE
jgi:tRNA(Ile)-lysidine synthase